MCLQHCLVLTWLVIYHVRGKVSEAVILKEGWFLSREVFDQGSHCSNYINDALEMKCGLLIHITHGHFTSVLAGVCCTKSNAMNSKLVILEMGSCQTKVFWGTFIVGQKASNIC